MSELLQQAVTIFLYIKVIMQYHYIAGRYCYEFMTVFSIMYLNVIAVSVVSNSCNKSMVSRLCNLLCLLK